MRTSTIRTRSLLAVTLIAVALAVGDVRAADPSKVLHIATDDVLSLDPQQPAGIASTRVAMNLFQALYSYDYFADPATVIPDAAAALPKVSDDGLTWTIPLRHRLVFADDPVFRGRPREVGAYDFVYSLKRAIDPNLRTGGDAGLAAMIDGAREFVDAARAARHTDYDRPIRGLAAPDRYTLRIRLAAPDYTLLDRLTALDSMVVAREVVEAAGVDLLRHPVGSGPYRLVRWDPSSRLVLEANPRYESFEFPRPANPREAAVAQRMQGRKLPQVGRIELAVIEESKSRLLAFERGDLDYLVLAGDDARGVLEQGQLDPALAAQGIALFREPAPSLTFTLFDMDNPVVGGDSPSAIALRRAIALGFDTDALIRVLYAGMARPASQPVPPGVNGYDSSRPAHSLYDPAAARALLDAFGYAKRDADGYRLRSDGSPLVIVRGTFPQSWYRDIDTLWKKDMDAIGLRIEARTQAFPELVRQMRTGEIGMLSLSLRVLEPSGNSLFQGLWGDASNTANLARFHNADYDAAYSAFVRTPDGAQRATLAERMATIVERHAPIIVHTFGIDAALAQPWLSGYWPSAFGFGWKYLDVDMARREARVH